MTTYITLDQAKQNMRVTSTDEDDLITAKIAAAQGFVENYLGTTLDTFTTLPAPITEAMLQLIAFWYDNREAAIVDARLTQIDLSPGFYDALKPFRVWSF